MKSLVLLLALVACQSDTKNLNDKIDKLDKKIDALLAQRGGAAAGQQRGQQRPQPDAAKTYAVPIDGDFFEGPADAKITIVKCIDYA